MNSGFSSLAVLMVAHKLFAAENGPTTRNLLPPPPTNAASVAVNPAATDVGSLKSANTVQPAELPPLAAGAAFGSGALLFTGVMNNTDVFFKTMQAALSGGNN